MMDLKGMIVDVPDFPKPGVIFKDLTPIIQSAEAFNQVIDELVNVAKKYSPDRVAAIESRGLFLERLWPGI
jgi:Adenine/guanine phosphoribosyltransferases and related PRPP-binding proteins